MKSTLFKFKGMNNVEDPTVVGAFDKELRSFTEAVSLNNVDMSPTGETKLRKGFIKQVSGDYHSAWSTPDFAQSFLVDGTQLKSFNGTTLSSSLKTVASKLPMSFCKVNDVIVFSNGVDFGVIENGGVVDPFIPTSEFKVPMQPGQFLEWYNGRLYSLYNDVLYCSESLDTEGGIEQMDLRQNEVAWLKGSGTMLKAVDDGLWVASEEEVIFLQGDDPFSGDGFTLKEITPYGSAYGTAISAKGELFGTSGKVAIWTSVRGICIGGNSGAFRNMSQDKMAYDFGRGAAFLREEGGDVHYITTMTTTQTAYNKQ
jgi:hypothetical protein